MMLFCHCNQPLAPVQDLSAKKLTPTWPRFGEASCSAAPPRWDKSLGTKMWHNLVSHAMQGHSLETL